MDTFPHILVRGGAHERGVQYGIAAAERIRRSCDIYFPAFAEKGIPAEAVASRSRVFLADLEEYDPETAEEIRGIASGADLEVETIVALNARTEILYATPDASEVPITDDGCTTVGVGASATVDGHTLLGQNWDWRPECRDTAIVLQVVPDDGPEYISFVEPGLMARGGVNENGIGVVGNFLASSADFGQRGIPIPFMRRKVMRATNYADAISAVLNSPRACSANHLIGAVGASVIDLECSPTDVFHVSPGEREILTHTNHFISSAAQATLRDTGKNLFPDSLYRDRFLFDYLSADDGGIGLDNLQAGLSSHRGYPQSICRHSTGVSKAMVTVASMVMDLDAGELLVARGPVCENEFTSYGLESKK